MFPLRDYSPYVVGQAAVGKGDVLPPLEEDDPGRLVEPSRPGSRSGTPCHSSDDQKLCLHGCLLSFHGLNSFFRNRCFFDSRLLARYCAVQVRSSVEPHRGLSPSLEDLRNINLPVNDRFIVRPFCNDHPRRATIWLPPKPGHDGSPPALLTWTNQITFEAAMPGPRANHGSVSNPSILSTLAFLSRWRGDICTRAAPNGPTRDVGSPPIVPPFCFSAARPCMEIMVLVLGESKEAKG